MKAELLNSCFVFGEKKKVHSTGLHAWNADCRFPHLCCLLPPSDLWPVQLRVSLWPGSRKILLKSLNGCLGNLESTQPASPLSILIPQQPWQITLASIANSLTKYFSISYMCFISKLNPSETLRSWTFLDELRQAFPSAGCKWPGLTQCFTSRFVQREHLWVDKDLGRTWAEQGFKTKSYSPWEVSSPLHWQRKVFTLFKTPPNASAAETATFFHLVGYISLHLGLSGNPLQLILRLNKTRKIWSVLFVIGYKNLDFKGTGSPV